MRSRWLDSAVIADYRSMLAAQQQARAGCMAKAPRSIGTNRWTWRQPDDDTRNHDAMSVPLRRFALGKGKSKRAPRPTTQAALLKESETHC